MSILIITILISHVYYDITFSTTPDIFNKSGNWELVEKLGDWFSYDKTPRQEKKFANYFDKTLQFSTTFLAKMSTISLSSFLTQGLDLC